MTPITITGRWVLGVAGGDPPRLLVAPVGRHVDVRAVAPRPGEPAAAALDIDIEDLAAPGAAAALAGVAWAEVPDGGWWRIPGPTGPRALLLGASPAASPLGARALEGPSGLRLARLCGIGDLSSLLGTFETANVLPDPARAASLCRARHVVVLGDAALAALALEAGVARSDVDLGSLRSALGAASLRTIDHPSGRSLRLNPDPARIAASARLLAAALDARGVPHLAGPAELAASKAAEWAEGRRGDALELRHMRAAWACAAACGVAWPGSVPGAGWQRNSAIAPRSWVRTLAGGVRAFVDGPPWTVRAWRTEFVDHRVRMVTDEDGALLLGDQLARTLGGRTPWEMRDAELAAESARDLEGAAGLEIAAGEVTP